MELFGSVDKSVVSQHSLKGKGVNEHKLNIFSSHFFFFKFSFWHFFLLFIPFGNLFVVFFGSFIVPYSRWFQYHIFCLFYFVVFMDFVVTQYFFLLYVHKHKMLVRQHCVFLCSFFFSAFDFAWEEIFVELEMRNKKKKQNWVQSPRSTSSFLLLLLMYCDFCTLSPSWK